MGGGFCGSESNAMSVKEGVIQNECFVDVLNIIPHALLALVCIFILTVWNHSVIGKLKVKTWVHFQWHNARWIFTLALITTIIVEIAEGFISDLNDTDSTNYHAFVPACVSFLGALLSIIFYHNVEQWNSPKFLLVLLIYWPMAVVLKGLKALSIYRNDLTVNHLKVWLALIDILFYSLLLVIELNVLRIQRYSFFKKPRRMRPPSDLENTKYLQSYVNFMSQAVYWWITDLLIKGFKNPLTLKDLGKLPQSERSTRMYKKLQMIFEEEKFKSRQRNKNPSLMFSFLRAAWPMLILSGLFRLIGDCLAFVGPLLIEQIVDYAYEMEEQKSSPVPDVVVATTVSNSTKSKVYTYVTVQQFFWNGYVLSVVLFLASLLQQTLLQNHHFIVIREGIRVRTAVQAMVYSKALKLSTLVLSNGQSTLGQIMNHMSIDSTFLMFFFFFVHYIWALPIQVSLSLLLMYYKLGLAAVIGGLFVICAAPLMYLLGVCMSRMQKKVMLHSDSRVKKVNEVVQGMKVIKLLAWEPGFIQSVGLSRSAEMSYLLPHTVFKALMGFIGICAPVIGTLLTFMLYPMLEDKPLTAGATMSVLAIFNLLQGPLQIMSLLSASIANAQVSCGRLLPFLMSEEINRPHESLPSLSKSCSVGFDSAPSGHATVDKLDSVISTDGKSQTAQMELLPLENRSCRSSICSNASAKMPSSPTQSRQNSTDLPAKNKGETVIMSTSLGSASGSSLLEPKRMGLSRNATSSELLDVKPSNALLRKSSAPALAVSEFTGDYKRRRHHSNRSVDEEDPVIEDYSLMELQTVIDVQGGNFSWDLKQEDVALNDITVKIPTGKLSIVVGQVGSGKSSLLSAFLGEMIQVSGNMHKSKNMKVAYVSQRPWLLNASLKDNILFGKPFVWRKYRKVISACALGPDIEILPAADNTEIGEKGVNLSGGQKQRVSIARALYSEADTVFLDDPLSALDSHVGRHVMEEAIMKRLVRRNRTVVLVTHHLQYLSHAHQVIVMANGHIHFHGKVGEVKKFDPDLYDVWRKAIRDAKASEISQRLEIGDSLALERKHSGGSQVSHDTIVRPSSSQSLRRFSQLSVPGLPGGLQGSGRKMSAMSVMTEASNEDGYDDFPEDEEDGALPKEPSVGQPEEKGKLIKQEHKETGAVTMWVYLRYLQACSFTLCFLSLLLQVLYHTLIVSSNFWLSVWAADAEVHVRNATLYQSFGNNTNVTQPFDNSPYLMTFVYLSIGSTVATLLGCLVIYHTGYVASKVMFTNLLANVIHLPMRFFDTNPSGRILNRFSSDITAIDQRLGGHVENLLRCVFFTLSAVVVNTVTTPYFIFAAVPFFILYYCLQRFFRASARELQRLDSVTKSPIFSHFSETVNGLSIIRAFGVQPEFKRRAFKAIDTNIIPFLFIHTANRWLGVRLDFMSCLLVFISAVASLSSGLHGLANPAFIGLCITYTLMVSGQLNWIVRITTEVEMSMNSVERVVEYTDMIPEPTMSAQGPVPVPDKWPSVGKIEFQNVTLSYDIDLEPVLLNASFIIQGGEKIGVCGRTGSGKSSTTLALFRMLDLNDGLILLDGVDIMRVPLHTLRARLAIIPQDPVLFTGTLRFNLDPNSQEPDDKLWSALESVEMKDTVTSLPDQLDSAVAEGGENFSVGQRQLLCMARAFLRDSQVIVMDEATASIDMETDSKIQSIIHSPVLQNRTIITIAHRMSTIMNYDRVMVLEYGDLKEFAPPSELLADVETIFHSLVHGACDADLK
ncbi:ATP-binding cassette sub-family C member 9 isoform X2 [Aplysia californica]|uniref:ATP-binding cassette sub-family C member 9 isoform X2 n=1 Tax=Aplysia californica TaxID=6500 RepID=A0ABM1VPV5_APLCA|nr:ATP-binding cassette sub-family C member 9 isoform X2 [Aplysia californica]